MSDREGSDMRSPDTHRIGRFQMRAAVFLAVLALGPWVPGSARAVDMFVTAYSHSGDPLDALSIGDLVTIEIAMVNTNSETLFAFAGAAQWFDADVVSFQYGRSLYAFFFDICAPTFGCLGGLANQVPARFTSGTAPDDIPFAIGLSVSPTMSTGLGDWGLFGGTIATGDVHATLTFATATEGSTTIVVQQDFATCSGICLPDVPLPGAALVPLNVTPEPSVPLTLVVGGIAIGGLARRRAG